MLDNVLERCSRKAGCGREQAEQIIALFLSEIVEELAQKIRENADKLTGKPAKKGGKAPAAAAPAPAPAPSTAKIDITVEDEA